MTADRRSGALRASSRARRSRLCRVPARRARDRRPVRRPPRPEGTKRDAAEAETRIVADRLTKRFGDFVAVDAVSFEARAGEIIGFLGPNGAGKSTLIRVFCGLLNPSGRTGRGHRLRRRPIPRRVRENIGYMSQKFSLYGDLSVMENLRFFGGVYGVKGARLEERLKFAIGMARLEGSDGRTRRRPFKRLEAAPCAWLRGAARTGDPVPRRADFRCRPRLAPPLLGPDLFARRKGVCVAITTHYMDEAEYCNRIALINGGKLAALGSPTELKRHAIHGEILLVEGDNPGAMLEALEGAPAVLRRAPFGSSLHIAVNNAAHDRPAIKTLLRQHELAWSRIETIKPTLEDVFVRLVAGDSGGKGGP